MTDRELIRLATRELPPELLAVWLAKHIAGKGRRAGSLTLGITEDAWRYRLQRAEQQLERAITQEPAT